MKRRNRRRAGSWLLLGVLFPCVAGNAGAQTLVASDDDYGVPFGGPLVVDPFGVLDNDTLDGENAGENGVTAELVNDVSHGTLALASDGSFTYAPGVGFDGSDAFTYRAVFGALEEVATVTVSACSGGPQRFLCWREAAYLAKAAELGFDPYREGFENDAVWGSTRSPDTAPSVTSQGIQWRSNHPDPPASNEITTGGGPARSGDWGIFDPEHGYATGTPAVCDVDVPPPNCLFHDGFTGTWRTGGAALNGAGGFFTGSNGANVAVVLDGTDLLVFGHLSGGGHQFFGVVDADPAGFSEFEFRELDGKVGQSLLVFGDDFTVLLGDFGPVPALPAPGLLAVGVLLAVAAARFLR